MLAEEEVQKSPIAKVSKMCTSSTLLALFVLNEQISGTSSFWHPYLDVLPCAFSTPFYLSNEALSRLSYSPSFGKFSRDHNHCHSLLLLLY